MKRFLFLGLIVALLSSIVGATYLYFFYGLELDESSKVLPIWKVVAIYTSISLLISLMSYIFFSKWGKWGVIILNTVFSSIAIASIAYPITYVNQEIDTTFIAIAAIPVHFMMPLIWLSLQPIVLIQKP
ncbi:MAG: hypothetical protein EBR91_02940 [Flavobacteriia bacterium]|nr:hypothetical protein [Flavobacteriia bacterium]NBV91108.1 hypothetical protein [Flavobacteriia bacterium]